MSDSIKNSSHLSDINAAITGNGLHFIKDPLTNINFLIDTGSAVSIVTPDSLSFYKIKPNNALPSALRAANGSQISTYGSVDLTVSLGLDRKFTFSFTIADITTPIIGMDF